MLGLIFLFFCFKLIIIHYLTQKQKKIKIKPEIELNHNISTMQKGAILLKCVNTFVTHCNYSHMYKPTFYNYI